MVFDYYGRHRELLGILTPADVRWAAERWSVLTPEQWNAAFDAAGYAPPVAERYIRKLQQKVTQGLTFARATTGDPLPEPCATSIYFGFMPPFARPSS